MQITQRLPYIPSRRTRKQAINEKMTVLREFGVANDENEESIREKLVKTVEANPNRNFDIVLDQLAQSMIKERLND